MNVNVPLQTDVVTIGESMILIQPWQDGPLAAAPLFTRGVAGAESNVAIGLTRLGKRVRWIGRLGTDPFGDIVVTTLRGEGVDLSCVIRDSSAPTAIYFKENKGIGDPNVYYYRKNSAASRLTPEDIQPEWFAGARHLHVTGITPALGEHTAEAIATAMKQARAQGMTVSLDPNIRLKLWDRATASKVLHELIPLCDVFLPGVEEAELLAGAMEEEAYLAHFSAMGPQVVALKLGERGSVGYAAGKLVPVAGYKVQQVIDTVGAGDAFASGFISVFIDQSEAMLRGDEDVLRAALQRANTLGALATQYRGDWEGFPTLDELNRVMQGKANVTR